jgi:hypothetical protein
VGGPLQFARGVGCALPKAGCASYMASTPQQSQFCSVTAAAAVGSAQRNLPSPSQRSLGPCSSGTFSNGCGLVSARGGQPTCLNPTYQYGETQCPADFPLECRLKPTPQSLQVPFRQEVPNLLADNYSLNFLSCLRVLAVKPEAFGWFHGVTSRAYPVTYKFEVPFGSDMMIFPASGNQGDKDAVCFPTVCQSGQVGAHSVRLVVPLHCCSQYLGRVLLTTEPALSPSAWQSATISMARCACSQEHFHVLQVLHMPPLPTASGIPERPGLPSSMPNGSVCGPRCLPADPV